MMKTSFVYLIIFSLIALLTFTIYTPVLLILPTIPGYKNAFVLELIISIIFGIFIGIQSAKIKRENGFIVLSLGVLGGFFGVYILHSIFWGMSLRVAESFEKVKGLGASGPVSITLGPSPDQFLMSAGLSAIILIITGLVSNIAYKGLKK
jgi:uncharacterized membrane protein YeaQ/YmgE (transglycosylase-associated protein family)